ncbi:MAG: hypothetical protein NVS3B21_36750 [Acidimicrobiales bacterium]
MHPNTVWRAGAAAAGLVALSVHGTTVSLFRDHLGSGELAVTNFRATNAGQMVDAFVVVNAGSRP